MLVDLSGEVERTCAAHTQLWQIIEQRLLEAGEVDSAVPLRIETQAFYNPEEDAFEADTFFYYSPSLDDGELQHVKKTVKRLFGFIYLRTLRTGSPALRLERGSLLDLILRLQCVRTGLWEKYITRLRSWILRLIRMPQPFDQYWTRLKRGLPSTFPQVELARQLSYSFRSSQENTYVTRC